MKRLRLAASVVGLAMMVLAPAPRANAESKDMIALQTQMQALLDAVARLQQANDERMGVLKDLVQQTADSVNKMSVAVNGLQLRMQNTQDAITAKNDQVSGQVQTLNDSVDELKARLQRMEKVLTDVQSQQGQANAILTNLPQPGAAPAVAPASGPAASAAAPPSTTANGPAAKPVATKPPPAAGPSSAEMYRGAYSDYMSGKYSVAADEFDDLIKAYPDDNLAGNGYFYLGEIDTKANKPSAAIKDYDHLLERYPDNAKIPAAHLHKAEALISSKQQDAGARELRTLINRFPNSPEAATAKTRLAGITRR